MNQEEFFKLLEAVREQTISDKDWARLQDELANPDSRRAYINYMTMVGQLHNVLEDYSVEGNITDDDSRELLFELLREQQLIPKTISDTCNQQSSSSSRIKSLFLNSVLAAAMLLAAVIFWNSIFSRQSAFPVTFATISETKNCQWGSGSLPTLVNSRIYEGQLSLVEGLATIRLDNGIELTLEAPATIELISPQSCRVIAGQIVAKVPESQIGFTVETPNGRVIDLGTEFGVMVNDSGQALVDVLSGKVDIKHTNSGTTKRLYEHSSAIVAQNKIMNAQTQPHQTSSAVTATPSNRTVLISTAHGRGQDAFVSRKPVYSTWRGRSEPAGILLLKRSVEIASHPAWDRKVYLKFDLANVDPDTIEQVELVINFSPTGLGFSSRQPDSVFVVYGLLNENQDQWDEQTINWKNAPASGDDLLDINESQLVRLGEFAIPRGIQSVPIRFKSNILNEWIIQDSNSLVTFLIIRETIESKVSGLVHGIVSKEHPSALPPMLRITTSK